MRGRGEGAGLERNVGVRRTRPEVTVVRAVIVHVLEVKALRSERERGRRFNGKDQ